MEPSTPETSFLDDVLADSRQPRGPRCSVISVLDSIAESDPALADQVRTAITNLSYAPSSIARVLSDRGYELGAYTISRHRNRGCACHKRAAA